MITIVPYQSGWPEEFLRYASDLRAAFGPLALRIDHIGSTSVPGLAAKDIVDIQITVATLEPGVEEALERAGYMRIVRIFQDHIPPKGPADPEQWTKWFFQPPAGARPANIHVRMAGHANQRYAVLFRDYLRTHPAAAAAYAQVKSALAGYHSDDADAYYAVKDPVCDIIMAGADAWAAETGWQPGPSGG